MSVDSDSEDETALPALEPLDGTAPAILMPADEAPASNLPSPIVSPAHVAGDQGQNQPPPQAQQQQNFPFPIPGPGFLQPGPPPPDSPLSPQLARELSRSSNDPAMTLTSNELAEVEFETPMPSPEAVLHQHVHEEHAMDDGDEEWASTDGESEDGHNEEEADIDEMFHTGDEDSLADPKETTDLSKCTFQDGLPLDPLLPLALVSRSFLSAVRSKLYGKTIVLEDTYQSSLFLRTLENASVSSFYPEDEPDADDEELRKRYSIPWLVRHLIINIDVKTLTLARGGGSVILDILKHCTRMEHFICGPHWPRSAESKLIAALQGCTEMRSIALSGGVDLPEGQQRRGTRDAPRLAWTMNNLTKLLSGWKHLEGVSCFLHNGP